MSELKSCPFCNGEATMEYTYYEGPVASNPKCNKYGCIGFTYREFETEAEAIEAWNHRPFEAHAVEVLSKKIGFLLGMSKGYEGDIDQDERDFLADFEGSEIQKLAIMKAKSFLGLK